MSLTIRSQIAYEIDKEVQRIVKEQYERCKQILLEHKEQLILIAETLLTEETLVAEQNSIIILRR